MAIPASQVLATTGFAAGYEVDNMTSGFAMVAESIRRFFRRFVWVSGRLQLLRLLTQTDQNSVMVDAQAMFSVERIAIAGFVLYSIDIKDFF